MELFARVGVIAVLVIAIAALAFIATGHGISAPLTQDQAVQYVLSDVRSNNPAANISVIAVSPSVLKAGSWDIVLSVVYNATRPCPTLFIEAFDYPATGFVPSVDNLYTTRCVVYGASTAPSYVISSPYIAIARSYNQSFAPITDYVGAFGYNNTQVRARYFANLNESETPLQRPFQNVWLINYTARYATYSEFVIMTASGSMLANYTLAK